MNPPVGNLAVLGSTGSIGTQTLAVVRANPGRFRVTTLAAGTNAELLCAQAKEFRPELVAIRDSTAAEVLRRELKGISRVVTGEEGICEAAAYESVHTVVGAIVGFAGLKSVLEAVSAGKHVALANKESLVAGGAVLKHYLKGSTSRIVPVDSEHSSIFQCLLGRGDGAALRKVVLTASGGPFLHTPLEEMYYASPQAAVKHPRWNMGAKNSIDSASLMNKGLEVLEAAALFDLSAEQIEVMVHPQTIVHGFAEYQEGTLLAALFEPDMRVPISFALGYLYSEDPVNSPGLAPIQSDVSFVDLLSGNALEFFPPDLERFPALGLCYRALRAGGAQPAVLNAANEVAVELFLAGRIAFGQIPELVSEVMDSHGDKGSLETLEDVLAADQIAREMTIKLGAQFEALCAQEINAKVNKIA